MTDALKDGDEGAVAVAGAVAGAVEPVPGVVASPTTVVHHAVIVGPAPVNQRKSLAQRELRDLLRSAMRNDLNKLLPQLWAKYEDGKINALQFAEFLAKYGLGQRNELDVISPDVVSRLRKQAELIMARDTWTRSELIDLQRQVWGG